MKLPKIRPRVLFFDIETAPIKAFVWALWDQTIGTNQIKEDWHILSWSAKWKGENNIMYSDQRRAKNIENDKVLLRKIWKLLDAADIVVTQNGKAFDSKKLNARFVLHGFPPPSPYRHIDTLEIARKKFGFTSNRLEYLSNALNTKVKKLSQRKFDGFNLWRECMAGNIEAWNEMEKYNKQDVLALEQVYDKIIPWDNSINFNVYKDGLSNECKCGSTTFHKRGFVYTNLAKYQAYRCSKCGASTRGSENLLSKDKRKSLHRST